MVVVVIKTLDGKILQTWLNDNTYSIVNHLKLRKKTIFFSSLSSIKS